MISSKLSFGIIGYGKMGKIYHEIFERLGINVSFICDKIDMDVKTNFFNNYVEALEKTKTDGIVISTHAPSHFEIMNYAIEREINFIICEKPFTISIEQADKILEKLKLKNNDYVLVTAHRSENVDDPKSLMNILNGLEKIHSKFKKRIIYPMHPRTLSKLNKKSIPKCIEITKPLGFFEFSKLEKHAFCYISDSGTLPEDALIYKKPCIIIRESTERPEFLESGCCILSGLEPKNLLNSVKTLTSITPNWEWNDSLGDGRTSYKVANIIGGKLIRVPSKF